MEPYRPPHLRRREPAESPGHSGITRSTHDIEDSEDQSLSDEARTTAKAISEGRRIYVGNMPYFAKEADIRTFFQGWPIEHISISIDPFTGRNPSYAFVDLSTSADAQHAIAVLNEKEMLGRPLRIKPGVAPRPRHVPGMDSPQVSPIKLLPGRGRVWDRWKKPEVEATEHFNYAKSGRRVYVGKLPSFDLRPARVDAEIKHFFNGFHIEAISKIIPPHPSNIENGHYVFVDFSTIEEASRAVRELNGARFWDRNVRVDLSKGGHSWKVEERDRYMENHGSDEGRLRNATMSSFQNMDDV